jgi:hypothetical protein
LPPGLQLQPYFAENIGLLSLTEGKYKSKRKLAGQSIVE